MRFAGLFVALALLSACGAAKSSITQEAEAFMQSYATDLRAGDRQAVANRYDRKGARIVRGGSTSVMSFAEITDKYVNKWTPPVTFDWSELKYDPLSDDAILVAGKFTWSLGADSEPASVAYTAVLQRQDGELRILAEHESGS